MATIDDAALVQPGDQFELGVAMVDRDSIVAFARLYDPQPFHLDEQGGVGSVFGGLVASGLQTLAVVHAMAVRSGVLKHLGAIAGLGMDKMRLLRPVRPGDELRASMTTLTLTPSRSRPGHGVANCRWIALNQNGETVLTYESSVLVQLDRWQSA